MPELQMDVAVANRFISSLSKSLQALCHGCMEFDSGIEIVGYINVNIDCGSKVDYVLNEKVLKSTTNSMTFVSNSFLAKKEQAKQTRDGACSPILDINHQPSVMSQYQNRLRGSFHGSHTRSAAPFSYVHRGSQKRSWSGMDRDWRISPKKQRDGRLPYPSPFEPASSAASTYPHSLSSSSSQNQSESDANFKWPQISTQGSDTNNADGQLEINIKKEICDNDSEKAISQNDQDQSQASDQEANDNSDEPSKATNINIKNDPDASTAADDETHVSDGAVNETDTDFKGTFLEPSTSEDNEGNTEQTKPAVERSDENQLSTFDSSESAGKTSHMGGCDNSKEAAAPELPAENVAPGSEMPVEYDEAGEEEAYPQSVYSDAGEGSSDAGQFEVIEIDDEDEDVQAMFGGSRSHFHGWGATSATSNFQKTSISFKRKQVLCDFKSNPVRNQSHQCPNCSEIFPDQASLTCHTSQCQRSVGAYYCSLCGKTYSTSTGLKHHMEVHEGKTFMCPICDSKFTRKGTVKTHMRAVHASAQCVNCAAILRLGSEFNQHVVHCVK